MKTSKTRVALVAAAAALVAATGVAVASTGGDEPTRRFETISATDDHDTVVESTTTSTSAAPSTTVSVDTSAVPATTAPPATTAAPATTTPPATAPALTVPNVIGATFLSANAALSALGLNVATVYTDVGSQDQHHQVFSQSPSAGAPVSDGQTVTLTIGRYEDRSLVPRDGNAP